MMKNISPWLNVPGIDCIYPVLSEDLSTDILVVGGGIAGCVSAFEMLENTEYNVVLLEGNRVAHGATGHNAGQIDVFFEKPITDIIKEYGESITKDSYKAMFNAWSFLEDLIDKIQWQGQYVKYIGYNAYTTKEQLFAVCEQLLLFDKLGLEINELFVLDEILHYIDIPDRYKPYINLVDKKKGNQYLGSDTIEWLCFEATHYGTLNSASLSYAIIQYLSNTYGDRFAIYEHTMVESIMSSDVVNTITKGGNKITSQYIILCTNAYHSYSLNDKVDIVHVQSVTGAMVGYNIPNAKTPTTISYQPANNIYTENYYYHSARNFINKDHIGYNLVTVGGPDLLKEENDISEEYIDDINQYIQKFYAHKILPEYARTGKMGYTENGFRKIGFHKSYRNVLYNLGCNGVGILGSVYGGWKISKLLSGEVFQPQVFDL